MFEWKSSTIVRLIRLLFLVLFVGASYLAQSIFEQRHISDLLSFSLGSTGTLNELVPTLNALDRMSPNEIVGLGMLIALVASIGFGLIASRWPPSFRFRDLVSDESFPFASPAQYETSENPESQKIVLGFTTVVVGLALSLIATAQISTFGSDSATIHLIWISGLLLFLLGAILIQGGRSSPKSDIHPNQTVHEAAFRSLNENQSSEILPSAGWPLLLAILISAMLLNLWQLWRLPARIDHIVAQIGLQSLEIVRGNTSTLFFSGSTELPMLAYMPSALMIQMTGDPLFGVRLAGVATGLLMILSTWLLCCELFRRVPRIGNFGTVLEDDGRWVALLAAVIVAFSHVTLHFSRLPVFLGPVVWGTLGLWALLRGLRRQHLPSLALSGMMIGLSSVLYVGGLFYLLVAPLWWIGVWLLHRDWFYAHADAVGNQSLSHGQMLIAPSNSRIAPRFTGNESFLLWLGGLLVVLFPFLATWVRLPRLLTSYVQNDNLLSASAEVRNQAIIQSQNIEYLFLDNLRLTLFTFNIFPNNGPLFDIVMPFLNSWLAPLLFLGLGALVLNIDRLPGWLMLISLFVGIISGAISFDVPAWLRLLVSVPLVAIIIAFAIDRVRVILLETAGTWLEQTTVYLTVGFLAWASLQGWLTYFDYGLRQDAPSSHIGRAIQSMRFGQTAVLLLRSAESSSSTLNVDNETEENGIITNLSDSTNPSLLFANGLDSTVIEFITSDISGPRERIDVTIGEWPDKLPEQSRLLIQPDDWNVIEEIKERYGEGQLMPVRNLRGDPVLYIYDIW